MTREQAKKLTPLLHAAMKGFADVNGLVYKPGRSMTFSESSLSGRFEFIERDKVADHENAKVEGLGLPYKVGDVVRQPGLAHPETYRVEGFTDRGAVNLTRLRDNRPMRLPAKHAHRWVVVPS